MSPNHLLRRARQRRGWSQAVVAQHLETTPQQVSRWERGETHPSLYFCTQLCDLFEQDTEALGLLPGDPSVSHISSSSQSPPSVAEHHLPIYDAARPRLDTRPEHIVGRADYLTSLLKQLAQGTTCVLFGLPGIGKSTLAHMVVNHPAFATYFPAGFLWIGLGPSAQITGEFIRLATLLGVPDHERSQEHSHEDWSRLLHRALEERRMLLIIDDAWTTTDVLPFLIGGSSVAHLVTTRLPQVAFALPSAHTLPVPELSPPESLTLLITLVPTLTTLPYDQLEDVLHSMGGLPLAITLLGRYLRTQTVGGQPRRLSAALASMTQRANRLQLALAHPPATLSSAQSTKEAWSLATIIRFSDEHLSSPARSALRSLSILPVKPGRFSENAALAVAAQDETILDALLDAGLLEGVEAGWYTLHQTIADYGRQTLTDLQPWHNLVTYASHFLAEQTRNIPALLSEYPVLLSALEATIEHKWHQQCFALIKNLEGYWNAQCLYNATEKYVLSALALAQRAEDTSAQILLCSFLSSRARLQTDYQREEFFLQKGLSIARQTENSQALMDLLMGLGNMANQAGNQEMALLSYQEALQLASQANNIHQQAMIYNNIGDHYLYSGYLCKAEESFRVSLPLMRQVSALKGVCVVLFNLGDCLQARGALDEADACCREALQIAEEKRYLSHQCRIYPLLGSVQWEKGMVVEALEIFEKGLALMQVLDELTDCKVALLVGLATVKLGAGELEAATNYLCEAEKLDQTIQDLLTHTTLACCWGKLLIAQRRFKEAQQRLQRVHALLPSWYERARADVEYVLAQVAAAQGNAKDTNYWGHQCLNRFMKMGHAQESRVRQWLTEVLSLNECESRSQSLRSPSSEG